MVCPSLHFTLMLEADEQARNVEWLDWEDPLESPLGGIIGSSEKGARRRFCLCDITAQRDEEGRSESRFFHQFEI
jgi:hypothetical protein